jgi:hypothetical protein
MKVIEILSLERAFYFDIHSDEPLRDEQRLIAIFY